MNFDSLNRVNSIHKWLLLKKGKCLSSFHIALHFRIQILKRDLAFDHEPLSWDKFGKILFILRVYLSVTLIDLVEPI